jgi:hypothetical protein
MKAYCGSFFLDSKPPVRESLGDRLCSRDGKMVDRLRWSGKKLRYTFFSCKTFLYLPTLAFDFGGLVTNT